MHNKTKIIEAVLFAAGESVELAVLAGIIGVEIPAARELLSAMREKYRAAQSGIQLIELNGGFQLCSNPEYHSYVERLRPHSARKTLTAPLLETLAIIMHKQPATKGMVEEIRGVNADHAVNKLLEYGLITELGRLDAPGKPILFGVSDDFLRHFGLSSINDLPMR